MTTTATVQVEPLRDKAGVVVCELWSKFNVLFPKDDCDLFLQPGQFLPLWEKHKDGWAHQKCVITTATARVQNGRPLVSGAGTKLRAHPTLEEWDRLDTIELSGAATQLLYPGGLRKLHVGPTPTLVSSSQRHYGEKALTAPKFREFTRGCKVMQGHALEIATPDRPDFASLPYAREESYNVMSEKIEQFRILPLPIILSDEEDVILADYPSTWKKALDTFYDVYNIRQAGIIYRGKVNDNLTDSVPNMVWRKPQVKDDLGHTTLDPDIYNRMLPFDGPNLIEEYL